MSFVVISLAALVVLGVIAALVSYFTKGGIDAPVTEGSACPSGGAGAVTDHAGNCSACGSRAEGKCALWQIEEEKK